MRSILTVILLALLLAGAAEAVDLSGPSEITSPGYYRLAGDLLDGGITVRSGDVILDGNGCLVRGQARSGTQGVLVAGPSTNVTVLNLTLLDWGTGLECRDLAGGRIVGVRAENCTENGIYLEHCREVDLRDCTVARNGYPGLAINNSGECRVIGATADENADVGIYIAGSRGIAVEGGTASRNGQNGIFLENTGSGRVQGCALVRNGYPGVALNESRGVLISDNLLRANRLAAIWLEGSGRCAVTRNAAADSEIGLVVRNSTGPTFAGGNLWVTETGTEGTTKMLPSPGIWWRVPGAPGAAGMRLHPR